MRSQLRKRRLKKGFSVSEMANAIGISESFYYKIEQGVRNPTIINAHKIASLLDGTVEELFFTQNLDETSNPKAKPASA